MKGGLFSILFILIVASASAQIQTSAAPETHKYSYSFSGKATQQQLDKLESGMYQIKGITQVKITYKPDSFTGLIFFSLSQYAKRGEQTDEFNAADIKRLISDSGLAPEEFKEL